MRKKSNLILTIIIAIGIILGIGYLLTARVDVLVAKQNIMPNTEIKNVDDYFETKSIPSLAVNDLNTVVYASEKQNYANKIIYYGVPKGSYLTKSHLNSDGIEMIDADKVAFSIKTDDVYSVLGTLRPGDEVNIIFVSDFIKSQEDGSKTVNDGTKSSVMLEKIKVADVKTDEEGKIGMIELYTTQEEMNAITLGAETGVIYFAKVPTEYKEGLKGYKISLAELIERGGGNPTVTVGGN